MSEWRKICCKHCGKPAEFTEMEIKAIQNTRNEWIPVSERLPDYETEVIVRGLGEKGKHYIFEFATRKEAKNSFSWECRDYSEISFKIIDWMPLPTPKEDSTCEHEWVPVSERDIENAAMNIVHQIGDELGLSVEKRQATNDLFINFAMKVIKDMLPAPPKGE